MVLNPTADSFVIGTGRDLWILVGGHDSPCSFPVTVRGVRHRRVGFRGVFWPGARSSRVLPFILLSAARRCGHRFCGDSPVVPSVSHGSRFGGMRYACPGGGGDTRRTGVSFRSKDAGALDRLLPRRRQRWAAVHPRSGCRSAPDGAAGWSARWDRRRASGVGAGHRRGDRQVRDESEKGSRVG